MVFPGEENAPCHLALGSGFPKCVPGYENLSEMDFMNRGLNESQYHTDFMIGTSDLLIEAETKEEKN